MTTRAIHPTGPAAQASTPERVTAAPSPEAVRDLEALRTKYALSQATLGRMLGVSQAALARWEKGEGPTDLKDLSHIVRVVGILERAAAVMRPEYIPTWVEKPSPACAEIGAKAPIDLMERGDYDAVEELLFLLGSGVAY